MSLETEPTERTEVPEAFEPRLPWRGAAVAGFVAAVLMGLAITVTQLSTLRVAIAALYGFPGSLAVGWLAHLVHGTAFGLLFAVVLADPTLGGVADHRGKSVAAGAVYGVVLAVAGAGIVMPIWLWAAGADVGIAVPHVTGETLAWHLVYGVVLGALFPSAQDRYGD